MAETSGTDAGWENHALGFYKEHVGEAAYQDRFQKQFEIPTPGFTSWLGLTWAFYKVKLMMVGAATWFKKRPAHPIGVGATGTLRIVENPHFPESDFFTKGRTFKCRVRHSNSSVGNDGLSDGRGIAVKFDDVDEGGPLDLLLITGAPPFFNAPSFLDFIYNYKLTKSEEARRDFLLKYPFLYENLVAALRNHPSSYTDLRYNSSITYVYKPSSGQEMLARFRVLPEDGRPETGLLSVEVQRAPWKKYENPKDDDQPPTYLRDEFKERLARELVEYTLQIQLHDASEGDTDSALFNSAKEWDKATHPWKDLAHITLTTALSDEVTEKTSYNIGNLPPSLSFKSPQSQYDFNSIPYLRAGIYGSTSWARR